MEFVYDKTRKRWPFNTGGCLIEVTAWRGLTVYINGNLIYKTMYISGLPPTKIFRWSTPKYYMLQSMGKLYLVGF